jgi:hypothetical protein
MQARVRQQHSLLHRLPHLTRVRHNEIDSRHPTRADEEGRRRNKRTQQPLPSPANYSDIAIHLREKKPPAATPESILLTGQQSYIHPVAILLLDPWTTESFTQTTHLYTPQTRMCPFLLLR